MTRMTHNPRTTATAWVAMTAMAALVVAPPAWAQGPAAAAAQPAESKRIGVICVPARSADTDPSLLLQTLFRAEIAKFGNARLTLPVEESDPTSLRAARDLVDRGAAMLRANQWPEALQVYRQAVAIVQAFEGTPDRRLFARVHKGMAIAQWMSAEVDEARAHARRSLLFWPSQTDTEWAYNLETSRLYRDVRVTWETTPDGSIVVSSQPARAEVILDGASRGFTPVVIEQAAAGPHHLILALDGYRMWTTEVSVASEQQARVGAELKPIAAQRTFESARSKFKRADRKLSRARPLLDTLAAAHGGLDALLVVSVRSQGGEFAMRGFVWKADGQPTAVDEKLAQDAFLLSNVRGLIKSLFGLEFDPAVTEGPLEAPVATGVDTSTLDVDPSDEDLFIKGGGAVFADEKRAKEDSIFDKWWFWTGAGVLLAGAITTGVILASSGSGDKSPTGTLQVNLHAPSAP